MSLNSHDIELRFPSSIYYADPYAAIRSVLGNDVEILDYKESNVILPDSSILVTVQYSAIDFDLFKLWKIEETKITSQQSQKVVATKLRDTVTNELLDENSESPKIVVISNYNPKYKLIFIKYLDRINANQNIKYYGFAPQIKSDVLHSYCSIVDSEFLSYHGTKLKSPQVSGNPKNENLNVQNEMKAVQKLANNGVETNNFTNNNFDLSVIFSLTGVDLKLCGNGSLGIEKEIKLSDVSKESGFINLSGKSIDEIKKAFVGQKGIILLSKFRDNIFSILYFNTNQSNNICITENVIDNLMLVMNYDVYNLKLWSEQ